MSESPSLFDVDADLARVAALFLSEATLEGYGEGLSVREHMLQAAELAAERGLAEPLIAAALLHDLGWIRPDASHETTAAELLRPLFGAAVATPVRLHVEAKRYLVAREPGYFETLSDASRRTLEAQGGPLGPDAADAFERLPEFASVIALRRVDEDAKIPGRSAPPFQGYLPLLERLARAHREGGS